MNAELAELLRSREARGLRVPAVGRMFFLALGLVVVVTTSFLPPRQMVSLTFAVTLTATLAAMFAVNGYIFVRLRQGRAVERLGLFGALVDAGFLIAMPVLGIVAGHEDGLDPAYMLQTELPVAIVTIVAINGLALRARYPIIVGVGAMVAILLPVVLALLDPTTQWSSNRLEVYAGPAHEASTLGTIVLMVAGSVAAVVFAARAARQTVIEGMKRQLEQERIRQEQLQIVMREKVKALRNLVAGVCHEVNTPVGAVRSSADTLGRVLDKIPEEGNQRALKVGAQSLSTIRVAVQRLSELEASLRTLSRLDEAEVQMVDLNAMLEQVLQTVQRNLGLPTKVVQALEPLPTMVLDATQINQALLTVITNAFEAAGPEGTVTVRSQRKAQALVVEIQDDGPGLAPDALARIFDVSLGGGGERVAVGLGLAAAQNAVNRHGGELSARSGVGSGACFTFRLPVDAPNLDA